MRVIKEDIIRDNVGNEYVKILDTNGKILNVIPPDPANVNVIPVKDIPLLTIESATGFGAIIKPQIAPRPAYQGKITQVIDCISPRDGIVGFINGDPYYGDFHIHPTTGMKMVGVAHTTTPHAIIYDTPAESRTSTLFTSQTNVSNTTTPSQTTTSAPSQTGTTDTSSQQETGQSDTSSSDSGSGSSGSSGSNGGYTY